MRNVRDSEMTSASSLRDCSSFRSAEILLAKSCAHMRSVR